MEIKQRYLRLLLSAIFMLILVGGGLYLRSRSLNQRIYRIVVFHSYTEKGEDGKPFHNQLAQALEKRGVTADYRHIYLNKKHFDDYSTWAKIAPQWCESLLKWKPDIILVSGDKAFDFMIDQSNENSDPRFFKMVRSTPMVVSNICAVTLDSIRALPKATGFTQSIDLVRNMEMISRITGKVNTHIEVDNLFFYDQTLYRQLQSALKDTTHLVNNSDFHVKDYMNADSTEKYYPNKYIITLISGINPSENSPTGDLAEGKHNTQVAFHNARNQYFLQAKEDIVSEALIGRSGKPQFTAIRNQFNDPLNVKYLGGYFVSMESEVNDLANYAARILHGEDPKNLPIAPSKKDYYLDYNAMQKMTPPLNYNEWKDIYNIVNVPFKVKYPVWYKLLFVLGFLAFIAIIAIIVYAFMMWRRRSETQLLKRLKMENEIRNQLLVSADSTIWKINRDGSFVMPREYARLLGVDGTTITREHLQKLVHPEDQPIVIHHLGNNSILGTNKLRIRMTHDGGETWSWYEIMYYVTPKTQREGIIAGLLLNIDDTIGKEAFLIESQRKANEVELKESFLANISHDLKTPLSAVTGFTQILASKDIILSDEDRKDYSEIIHQNSEMILKMIDNVLKQSRIEVGDIKLQQESIEVTRLVKECYKTNKIIAPGNLLFDMSVEPIEAYIRIDINTTKEVINNFLNNAFKFTSNGSVTLGWCLVDDGSQAEVYVEDTGIGIPLQEQSHVFERFYKVNRTDNGTGLGLNLCKDFMEKQGGTVGLISEEGKGSRFYFRMPIDRKEDIA